MITVTKARSASDIEAARALVWEFFDFVRGRYPDMLQVIDDYIVAQKVADQLDRFEAHFLPPNGEFFLGWHDGVPVGTVSLKRRGQDDGEVNRMYVSAAARGQGLGKRLAEAAILEARALGISTLYLDALHRHVEALPLYESLGFVRYEDPAAFGGADARVIHMRLAL
jgi:GNAT superfamily N-acetyltransferase